MTEALMAAKLTVALATTAARLPRLESRQLPPQDGVVYRVFAQGAAELPAALARRPDVSLTLTEGTGAARNRNAALAAVTSPLLLFADDDLCFDPKALTELIATFDVLPEADFLCARLSDEDGLPRKRYSPDGQPVRWWNCAKVGTPELAIRPAGFRTKGLGFDPAFGAGMPDYLGDEYIFLCDALRAGLSGTHVALTLASHPKDSSGTADTPANMEIRRRVLIRALGRWKSGPARLAFALRHRRRFDGWAAMLKFLR
jgi:hypothetical protein